MTGGDCRYSFQG